LHDSPATAAVRVAHAVRDQAGGNTPAFFHVCDPIYSTRESTYHQLAAGRLREDTRTSVMKAMQLGLLIATLFVTGSAQGGTGRQRTTFLVEAEEREVSRWIEQNSTAIDESTGVEVLAVRGRQSKLRKQTREGTFTLIVEHSPDLRGPQQQTAEHSGDESESDNQAPGPHGQFRTVLVKSDNAELVAQETEISVKREGTAARITITVVATVSNHGAMAISLGIRPSLRGMRKLLEGRFGSPNGP
jgi:hypothetical protein